MGFLWNKPINDVTESDLNDLFEVREAKIVEYKKEIHFNGEEAGGEFIADVTSFANTQGGYLFIGIKSNQGIPEEIKGISTISINNKPVTDPDQWKQNMDLKLRSKIEPRLLSYDIKAIPLKNKNFVIAIEIKQSWVGPHRNLYNAKFYARNSAGKYELDVSELHRAFILRESIQEKIRQFHSTRVQLINEGLNPKGHKGIPALVLHACPLAGFFGIYMCDISILKPYPSVRPMDCTAFNDKYVFDGWQIFSTGEMPYSYVIFFRSGTIEWGNSRLYAKAGEKLPLSHVETEIIDAIRKSLEFFQQQKVPPPIIYLISIINVKDFPPIDRHNLYLPEIYFPDYGTDLTKSLRPAFDALANACGNKASEFEKRLK